MAAKQRERERERVSYSSNTDVLGVAVSKLMSDMRDIPENTQKSQDTSVLSRLVVTRRPW